MAAFVMRLTLLGLSLFLLGGVAPLSAQVNTGTSAIGSMDPFWYFVSGQQTTAASGSNAYVVLKHNAWVNPPAASNWISLQNNTVNAPQNAWTTYYTTFTLTNPSYFMLSGVWSTDNNAIMFLNGVQKNVSDYTAFASLTPFALTDGFQAENVLAIQVYNGSGTSGNPTGLLVANLDGTSVVPEPAAMLLLGTGLLGIWAVARRRREGEV
jgi:hypothetical protein